MMHAWVASAGCPPTKNPDSFSEAILTGCSVAKHQSAHFYSRCCIAKGSMIIIEIGQVSCQTVSIPTLHHGLRCRAGVHHFRRVKADTMIIMSNRTLAAIIVGTFFTRGLIAICWNMSPIIITHGANNVLLPLETGNYWKANVLFRLYHQYRGRHCTCF